MYSPHLYDGSESEKRKEMGDYFSDAWDKEDTLFSLLKDESSLFEQPEPTRNPLVFYYGHSAEFYINKLVMSGILKQVERIDPQLEDTVSLGVFNMPGDTLKHQFDILEPHKVKRYRDRARETVMKVIATTPFPITSKDSYWAILMGIEHQRVHIETTSVLMRQLTLSKIKQSNQYAPQSMASVENKLINVPKGAIQFGKNQQDPYFGWDSEYGRKEVTVSSFQASQTLVSNGEYMAFVSDNGYQCRQFWSKEGWQWKVAQNRVCPSFWCENKDGRYFLRIVTEIVELPLDWPVEVSQYEATAFCTWKSLNEGGAFRLPSESEWRQMLAVSTGGQVPSQANHQMQRLSPVPVNRFQHGDFFDMMGNVWQWTCSLFEKLDGFEPHSLYDNYSAPYFNDYMMLMGGSFMSTGAYMMPSTRNAFKPYFTQHAGFRYVKGGVHHVER
ncbi:MAG: 5-histidylcysteine sulfoxide synthase [Candidatus Margulisbacteria bacterium]|nr:5-histidylcysteine sulfoxide synthase [Candidatus Margulisiibacteriota bacterium]